MCLLCIALTQRAENLLMNSAEPAVAHDHQMVPWAQRGRQVGHRARQIMTQLSRHRAGGSSQRRFERNFTKWIHCHFDVIQLNTRLIGFNPHLYIGVDHSFYWYQYLHLV